MSSTDTSTEIPEVGTIDMKLEVVTLPVSDVDRAKRFYQSLGWRTDADLDFGDGKGLTTDPQRRSYLTYAWFSDPDGDGSLLQEITTRLPGREWED